MNLSGHIVYNMYLKVSRIELLPRLHNIVFSIFDNQNREKIYQVVNIIKTEFDVNST